MILREIEPSDIPFLKQMNYLAGYRNSGSDPAAVVSFKQAQEDGFFQMWIKDWGRTGDAGYIAQNGARPVGAAWYRLLKRKADTYPHTVVSIGVQQSEQNKGVASLLLPRLVERAAADGAGVLSLTVLKSNLTGQALYTKVGFEPTGHETDTLLYMDLVITQHAS